MTAVERKGSCGKILPDLFSKVGQSPVIPAVLRAIFRDKISIRVLLDGLFFHHLPAVFIPRNGEALQAEVSFIFSGVSLAKSDGMSLMELTKISEEVLS